MRKNIIITILLIIYPIMMMHGMRSESLLEEWQFCRGAESKDSKWENVTIPHDWAISGPFGRDYDIQEVAISQNFEKKASVKTCRTGGLPYIGSGVYKTSLDLSSVDLKTKSVTLLFDGAMSEAKVEINGKQVCFWPYGYNSFSCDISEAVKQECNELKVKLENYPQSSRWYPGAGLYRNVHLIITDKIHIPVWGTCITTPYVGNDYATAKLKTTVAGTTTGEILGIKTIIKDSEGVTVATDSIAMKVIDNVPFTQNITVNNPKLWSPENPALYTASTYIYSKDKNVDCYDTRFGIRTIEVRAEKGFFLNGKMRKFKGVCNHHDLGPLGVAINKSALRHQLNILKDMGCDAIRTSHNMPAPELVELCDEMGFMMMLEPFDEWDIAKCDNGYHRYFNEWAEKDMINMIHQYRNNASVVMWSIGNEVPSQYAPNGLKVAAFLQDICHREDPTRPVTCGMDMVNVVVKNGFAAQLDVPGFNYRVHIYNESYPKLPQKVILGSETASTVSSRGIYKFPVECKANAVYDDHQSSSYDTEYCKWSNIPDYDFAMAEDNEWALGQFVWTGFDYLGEPTPYDTDAWPSHSSVFGIIDLASIPKDRYYLYRSVWNTESPTLHILPHWNFKGREGEITPVFVYTSYPKAELFINGKSQGCRIKNDSTVMNRYRLMWNETKYEPGELKVIAYDAHGNKAEEKIIKTAGEAYQLTATVNKTSLDADGKDLAYITIRVTDKNGNIVPDDTREVTFSVKGGGTFKAVANGDPTCISPFQDNKMALFSGALTAIVQSSKTKENIIFEAKAKGIKRVKIILTKNI